RGRGGARGSSAVGVEVGSGDLLAARLAMQALVAAAPPAAGLRAGVLALDVVGPQLPALARPAGPLGVRAVDRLDGAGAVVVHLERAGALEHAAHPLAVLAEALVRPHSGRALAGVHRAAGSEHRAERARVAVGDADVADELHVVLGQPHQAPAATGEHRPGRGPGRLDETVVAGLLEPLPPLRLLLLPDRAEDVQRDLGGAVLPLPVDLRDLEDD